MNIISSLILVAASVAITATLAGLFWVYLKISRLRSR